MARADRRENRRIPFRGLVSYFVWNEQRSATAVDISAGGLFLQTSDVLPIGALITLRLRFPGAPRPFTVLGRVARVVLASRPFNSGMGIRFLDLCPTERDRISGYEARAAS